MAHKKLKGSHKPKLSHTRKNVKSKGKEKEPTDQTVDDKAKAKMMASAARPKKTQGGKKLMNKKEAKKEKQLDRMHQDLYAGGERILLVGEGNFSFSLALCKHIGAGAGIYATCLDSDKDLEKKYADAAGCRKEIEELGGTCLTGVDAVRLHKVKEFKGAFRKIVFNFPHMGSGEKDVETNVAQHRQLLAAFFLSASKCLDTKENDCRIHVALKIGEPYKSWKIVQLARAVCPELDLTTVVPFRPAAWDGYAHRRTAGYSGKFSNTNSEELAKGAKVYVFRKKRRESEEK